ncbi:MAG: hypothetical protein JW981_02460, partial [Anaerolineae bacterium]|nr:hypothetical protein [Anaerolineae bacterium]
SLAVLGDENQTWRPQRYGYELWGCKACLEFPTVQLLDYRERWAELEQSDNPFAVIVMAHLKTQETRQDVMARKDWKFSLLRRLYEHGYRRNDVVNLFMFIDWLMNLPPELEQALRQELRNYEEEQQMDYMTSFERAGYQRGVKEGIEQGIEQTTKEAILKVLEVRFGKLPDTVELPVTKMKDLARLKTLLEKTAAVNSLNEFEALLN